jgi:CRP-like cAMP-binding protein
VHEVAPPGGFGERLLALRGFSLLSALPASELALVARLSRERDLQAGEALAVEGEPVQAVQLVVSGQARLWRVGLPIPSTAPLDTVGLLPLAAGLPHPFSVVAADPVHALEIDADLVAEVLEDDFALFARVLRLGAVSALARADLAAPAAAHHGPAPGSIVAGSARPSLAPLDTAERLLALRGMPLFRAAPVDGLAALAKRLELVQLPPGGELRTRAGSGDILLLVAGRARLAGGGDLETGAGAGAEMGVLEALADLSPALHLRALAPVQVLRGNVADLFDVLEDHHAMGRQLLAEILRAIAQ